MLGEQTGAHASDIDDAQAENKFKCPCHGSQYNAQGKVIRGPAPLVRPWTVREYKIGHRLLSMRDFLSNILQY